MTPKSVAFIVFACFANLKLFEFSEVSPISVVIHASPESSTRLYDHFQDVRNLKRTRDGDEGSFFKALEEKDYKTASRISSVSGLHLDIRDQDICDIISGILSSDETPLRTLKCLYEAQTQIFHDLDRLDFDDNPFFTASQRNINYLRTSYPDDVVMDLYIRRAEMDRLSQQVGGAVSSGEEN